MIGLKSAPQIPESLDDGEAEQSLPQLDNQHDHQTSRFILDPKIEADKYAISSIKFQTVALQSRIDVLESFEGKMPQPLHTSQRDIASHLEFEFIEISLI